MLTPVFVCAQDEAYVIVAITLSALCKVTRAAFHILSRQFTFHCTPYYLRLKFDQCIVEGRGERATFDVETSVLTVYLPKERVGELFTQLDNPAYLISTDKERRQMVQLVGTANAEDADGSTLKGDGDKNNDDDDDDDDEMEFRQQLHQTPFPPNFSGCISDGCGDYGFAGSFSGIFASLNPDLTADVLDLPRNPDETTAAERRRLRILAENDEFDEDTLLLSFEDADGEVKRLLQYMPPHRVEYLLALDAEGVHYAIAAPPARGAGTTARSTTCDGGESKDDVLEEEDAVLPESSGLVDVWTGNVATFERPLIEEVPQSETFMEFGAAVEDAAAGKCSHPQPGSGGAAAAAAAAAAATGMLAIPQKRPCSTFTTEEQRVLMCIAPPRLLFPPSMSVVGALTVDILFAEAYDDLVTEGTGCSESLWNICKLSPALSWLDPADNVYDACIFFARRALVYPLHRNMALIQRVFSSVGIRLLLGKSYVLKSLLRVHAILAHAEHRHILVTLFLNPLISYWINTQDADERLLRLALELHAHTTRVEPQIETVASPASPLLVCDKRQLLPLHLLNLGLPLSSCGGTSSGEVELLEVESVRERVGVREEK